MQNGGSLPVPSVQELSKENLIDVPPRYHRPQQQDLIISQVDHDFPEIPFIDMHNLLSQQAKYAELQKLHLACKQWGFFQLVNHGVDSTLLDKVKLEITDFFNLPMSEKKRFWQSSEDFEGFGQTFVVSENQKLDWSDVLILFTRPIHMRKPHLFPNFPLPLRL
ncbi:putative thebaine 6-O-demethylase [Lupinus albus]|uniref:Putative thebaine 6-O-demethylase n=1 Tax=Lupinus albus TaxID=3870 RepID=A0A6A4NVA7_LUPAL|nr:putative thebaine 6-O-demethylase [Lupinus albus]